MILMRVKISLGGRGHVPFNYNLLLSGLIYTCIKDVDAALAEKIHSNPEYSYFTFSLLKTPSKMTSKTGIYIKDAAHFFFSSPVPDISTCFIEGILVNPELRIGRTCLYLDQVEVLSTPTFGNEVYFSTLSPIIVRTIRKEGEKSKTRDLEPQDEKFLDCLKNNLKRKYEDFYEKTGGDISFSESQLTKSMRLKIKDTYHRGSMMKFKVKGNTDLIKFGFEAGFGEKTGLGFGMVEVV